MIQYFGILDCRMMTGEVTMRMLSKKRAKIVLEMRRRINQLIIIVQSLVPSGTFITAGNQPICVYF